MQPERAKSWLALVWPILQQGSAPLALLLLLLGGVQVWYLLGLVTHSQETAVRLFTALQESHKQHIELALRCHQSGGGE